MAVLQNKKVSVTGFKLAALLCFHDMSEAPTPEKRQRKPRQHSSLRSSSNDKKIKIKITTAREANRDHSGSEDELEPDVAIEEQFILRMPPGDACNKLRDMVRKRDVTDGVKFVFKGTVVL